MLVWGMWHDPPRLMSISGVQFWWVVFEGAFAIWLQKLHSILCGLDGCALLSAIVSNLQGGLAMAPHAMALNRYVNTTTHMMVKRSCLCEGNHHHSQKGRRFEPCHML